MEVIIMFNLVDCCFLLRLYVYGFSGRWCVVIWYVRVVWYLEDGFLFLERSGGEDYGGLKFGYKVDKYIN